MYSSLITFPFASRSYQEEGGNKLDLNYIAESNSIVLFINYRSLTSAYTVFPKIKERRKILLMQNFIVAFGVMKYDELLGIILIIFVTLSNCFQFVL